MGDVSGLFAEANEQIMSADNKEKLQRLLGTYERILERDALNYEALWSLGRSITLTNIRNRITAVQNILKPAFS